MNESKHKKKHKVVQSITYAPPTLDVWTKEQLFAKDCVASVYTKDIAGMTIPQLKDYIQKAVENIELNPQFVYSRHHIGNLVSHRAVAKEMKKVAMSSIPYILNNGHPVTKWEFKPDPQNPIDRMQSCLYGAPIMINDNKYLCLLTVKFNNLTGKIFPYVVNIEDGNGMKVSDDISVLDNNDATTPSNSGTSTGTVTSQDSRAPSNPSVKVQQNIETTKDNNIKTENYTYMNKKQIRLTESDLKQIVKESVNKILNEAYGTPDNRTKNQIEDGVDNGRIFNAFRKIASDLHIFLGYYAKSEQEEYSDLMFKYTNQYLKNMEQVLRILKNRKVQYYGEQPNKDYYKFHLPNHIYNGVYKPTPEELIKYRNGEDE